MSTAAIREIHVLVGVIFDDAGRILLAQRPDGKDLAGFWEFPGGKIEPGETRAQALARELHEELGIHIGAPRPLSRVQHAYPHKTVLLDFWIVRQYAGEARGLEGQSLRWCGPEEVTSMPLLPANRGMLRLLTLPEELVFQEGLDYRIAHPAGHLESGVLTGVQCATLDEAERAAAAGAEFLVMRALPAAQLQILSGKISIPFYASAVSLKDAWALGATGIVKPT